MPKGLVIIKANTAEVHRWRDFRRYNRNTGVSTVDENIVYTYPRMDDDRFQTEPLAIGVDEQGNDNGELLTIQELPELPKENKEE